MLDMNSYELINKCSQFVLFDLIRSVGGRETTATTTTESTTSTKATATVVAHIQQAAITRLKVSNSAMTMSLKCET